MADGSRVMFAVVADIPEGGQAAFRRYEDLVLPLLARHGGRLERRLRTGDGLTEVHVVSFSSEEGHQAYLAEPERLLHQELLEGVDVVQRLLRVTDVE